MSQCQSLRQRQRNRIAATNKMLIDEMHLLEANLQAVRIAQQEMAATKSAIDAFTWQFNSIKDSLNNVKFVVDTLNNMQYNIESTRRDLQNQVSQMQNASAMIHSSAWPLQTALTDVKKTIEDVNKIVNDPQIVRGLAELKELSESFDDL